MMCPWQHENFVREGQIFFGDVTVTLELQMQLTKDCIKTVTEKKNIKVHRLPFYIYCTLPNQTLDIKVWL